jgi:hypothetical protein
MIERPTTAGLADGLIGILTALGSEARGTAMHSGAAFAPSARAIMTNLRGPMPAAALHAEGIDGRSGGGNR